MANALFYLMAALAVAAALGVVLGKTPIQCVLALLASFFCLSVIYLLSGFQFLAAAQVLVYGGAILVLFLFVIMLLNLGAPGTVDRIDARMLARPNVLLVLLVAAALVYMGTLAVKKTGASAAVQPAPLHGIDSIPALADEMFGRYLLLATAVAVLVLAKRDRFAKRGGGGS